MTTSHKALLTTLTATATLLTGAAAATADEPAQGAAYSCDALTSASVPSVKKRLTSQGIDVTDVRGPIGLSCTKTTSLEEKTAATLTGIETVAFRCLTAEEKSGPKVVFFTDCDQP
jgi:hypothetical protein